MDLSKLVRPLAWQQMRDGAGELHHVWCADCPALEKRFYAEAEKHRTKVEARRTARILAALDHDAVAALLADAEERGRKAEREAWHYAVWRFCDGITAEDVEAEAIRARGET